MIAPEDRNTGSACRKRGLAWNRGRHARSRSFFPGGATVHRTDNEKPAIHRIAERDSVVGIPKRETIEECFRLMICKLKHPAHTAIVRLIDSGFIAFAG